MLPCPQGHVVKITRESHRLTDFDSDFLKRGESVKLSRWTFAKQFDTLAKL